MTPMVMGTIIGEEEEVEGARHHQTQERVPRNTDERKPTNHNERSMVNFKTAVCLVLDFPLTAEECCFIPENCGTEPKAIKERRARD